MKYFYILLIILLIIVVIFFVVQKNASADEYRLGGSLKDVKDGTIVADVIIFKNENDQNTEYDRKNALMINVPSNVSIKRIVLLMPDISGPINMDDVPSEESIVVMNDMAQDLLNAQNTIGIEITAQKSKDNLMKFAGALTDEEAEKIKKNIYEDRKIPSKRFA